MSLRKKGNKTEAPVETATEEVVTEEEVKVEEAPPEEKAVAVKPKADLPITKGGSLCIQNTDIVDALMDMDGSSLPVIYAKDGTHNIAGKEFSKEFTYFPVLQSVYWTVDPGTQDEEVKKEFRAFSDDDAKPDEAKLDRDGKPLGETLHACIKAGHSKAKIKRYVSIKCMIHEHEGTYDLGSENAFVILRIAPGSQWGPKGYETMYKKLKLAAAMGQLNSVELPNLDESVVMFKAVAENTSYKGGPTYTMSVVTPA